jgi:hypothetical protein
MGAGRVRRRQEPDLHGPCPANTPQSYLRNLGTFQSPNFLASGEADDSVIQRDATGRPQPHGLRNANFAAIVPACVAN